jgi:hypothetical protein
MRIGLGPASRILTPRIIALVGLVLALSACGGPRMREGELYAGRASSEPSMECLPDPDIHDDVLTEHMQFGMRLAGESFAVPAPPPPATRNAMALEEWSTTELRPWLERKTAAIEAARRELDAAAEENHRQRIMSGAIVGLMYEDVARVLANVPAPDDLDDEPEILDIYRQTLVSQSRPFVETARRGYVACARNATEPATMRHWIPFCEAREAELPSPDLASGETEVEVVPDP